MTSNAVEDIVFTPVTAAVASGPPGQNDGAQAVEAERQAQIAAFKAAAEALAAKVGWKTGTPIGRVIIPSVGMDVVMIEGTGKGDLREGPGRHTLDPARGTR